MVPLVSIIIPFYNDPYIPQAITSALSQTYPNVEIIVVDDGSTRHADLIQPYRNRVHYLGKANGGTASALNHGIRMASGEYIAWLSSDDLFYPHKLSMQIPYMQACGANFCFTAFDLINEHNQITQQGVAGRFPNVQSFYTAMLSANPINGCTVIMKKELLEQVGLFNEALPFTHDYDLWLRIILARQDLIFLDQSLIQYRQHAQMGTVRHQARITHEIQWVQSLYGARLRAYIQELSG
ncbi:glycosyl transferase [Paenibacillus rigui]|uniref:Glycosyl transferase n=2 Tax=Paenibacillus rigui TaxID=554312 RepID=A0A229UJK8_9BACL|nr:glycosyltransferase [Paenibacillus rigui]OXM83485.1 glycosyl transferase [Paenibacillus rigui]